MVLGERLETLRAVSTRNSAATLAFARPRSGLPPPLPGPAVWGATWDPLALVDLVAPRTSWFIRSSSGAHRASTASRRRANWAR